MYYGMCRVKIQLSGKRSIFPLVLAIASEFDTTSVLSQFICTQFICTQWNCLIFTEVEVSSSHRRCFIRKPAVLFKKRLAQIFSCKFWDYFKSTFFTKHLRATSSLKTRSRYITGENSKHPISGFNFAFYFLAWWPQNFLSFLVLFMSW